jgi:hypothetical protein
MGDAVKPESIWKHPAKPGNIWQHPARQPITGAFLGNLPVIGFGRTNYYPAINLW